MPGGELSVSRLHELQLKRTTFGPAVYFSGSNFQAASTAGCLMGTEWSFGALRRRGQPRAVRKCSVAHRSQRRITSGMSSRVPASGYEIVISVFLNAVEQKENVTTYLNSEESQWKIALCKGSGRLADACLVPSAP